MCVREEVLFVMVITGVKKAVGDYKRAMLSKSAPRYAAIMLDCVTGAVWTDVYCFATQFYDIETWQLKRYESYSITRLIDFRDDCVVDMKTVRQRAESSCQKYARNKKHTIFSKISDHLRCTTSISMKEYIPIKDGTDFEQFKRVYNKYGSPSSVPLRLEDYVTGEIIGTWADLYTFINSNPSRDLLDRQVHVIYDVYDAYKGFRGDVYLI